jgi:hypothetical protein
MDTQSALIGNDVVFGWLCKVIDTCYHDLHFEAVDNLINLYYERTKNEENTVALKLLRNDKWNNIHLILT